MFDLEQQIRQWRQSLAEALGGRAEVVEELEGHLRDEVQRLTQTGQTPEQAWQSAVQRLGGPRQLAAEFGKLPPAPWLPARLVLGAQVVLSAGLAGFLLAGLRQGNVRPLLACHVLAVTIGYTAVFAVGALAVWSVLTRAVAGWDLRRGEALRRATLQLSAAALVLTAAGVLLGSWWARDHLGRLWGWDAKEVGGLAVVAWSGLTVAYLLCRPSGELAAMLLGVLGNVVVSLSWFGAGLLAELHSYGGPRPSAVALFLVAFVVAQMIVLGVALLPAGRLVGRRA